MRDPERIDELLQLIRARWKQYPDLRLCQLLSNVAPLTAHGRLGNDLFYVEDDDLIKYLKEYNP